jgi:CRISPR/Cas system-associated exonuclease Cas4 (RecB family)
VSTGKQDMIKVSASGLEQFAGCPAAYRYGRVYSPLGETNQALKDGFDAHAILSNSVKDGHEPTDKAKNYAGVLRSLEESYDLTILARELDQKFEIIEGVILHRIMDIVAIWGGNTPVIIDYKTASKPWSKILVNSNAISAKSTGFQTACYLVCPPDVSPFTDKWANTMLYFIGTLTSKPDVITVKYAKEMEINLIDTIKLLKFCVENENFPKYRGEKCTYCNFQKICFNAKNWETLFREKEIVHDY